ncbi:MAG TPA: HdeD family acid-resistance protein [Thermoleophilia bacterium]|nr:HdeD family acid-resistance protein [Thermoleophilia bacterium]
MDDYPRGPEPPDDERVVIEEEVTISSHRAHALDRRASWALHNWPWVLGLGVVGIIFGIIVLSNAFGSVSALAWLTGLFLLFMGIVQLLTLRRGESRGIQAIGALIAIVGGIILLIWPGESLKLVAFIAGVTFLLWGVVRTVTAWREHRDDRARELAVGIALIVLGVLVMAWPGATIALVGILIGLIAIAWGATMIVGALRMRKTGQQWEELRARSRAGR